MTPHQECLKTHEWWWQTFDRMLPALAEANPEGAKWISAQVDYDGCNV